MPRLVVLLPSLGWGGAERIGITVHRMALRNGWTSRVDGVALPAICEGVLQDTGESLSNAPEVGRDHSPAETTLRTWARAARRRIAHERPDIVHAHLPYPDRITATVIAAAGRPLVVTFGLVPQSPGQWSPDEIARVRSDRTLALFAHTRQRTLFAPVSAADARILSPFIPWRKMTPVANVPPLAPARPPQLPDVDWPDGRVRILTVGRLHEQKGYDRLIAALSSPALRALEWHWVAVGAGEARQKLEQSIAAAGLSSRVTFAGARPADDLYARADVVLSPSRYEGLPLVPMEALHHRVPVVCSDIAPHHELLARAVGSILPADESEWPAALVPVLSDATERAALLARQQVVRPDDPVGRMWTAYESMYRALLSE